MITLARHVLADWVAYKAKWSDCIQCPLSKERGKVVLIRGFVPADYVFIGEAPGDSEDVIGQAFIGPAGSLLDKQIASAGGEHKRIAFTNTVACIPWSNGRGSDFRPPNAKEVAACSARLLGMLLLLRPKHIIMTGGTAKKAGVDAYLKQLSSPSAVKVHFIVHPSSILRTVEASRANAASLKVVATLKRAFDAS